MEENKEVVTPQENNTELEQLRESVKKLEAKNYELLNESLRMEEEVISRQAHVGELKEELHNAADTNLELRSELTKQKSEMQAWCDAT